MHAQMIATLYNLNCDVKGVPYTAADILGKGDREERMAFQLQQEMRDRMDTRRMMSLSDPGAGRLEAPEWLLGVIAESKMVH